MKLTVRNTHRDIAYFFLGLIIAFSISGIGLNHRGSWNPRRYVYESKDISATLPPKDSINDAFIGRLTKDLGIEDDVRRFTTDDKALKISYVNHDVSIDVATGQGKVESYAQRPLIAQFTKLHQDTSKWWIYYSDAFGLAMFTMAMTGMFIEKGPNSFRKRGWWLATLGILFPLIFLFLLS